MNIEHRTWFFKKKAVNATISIRQKNIPYFKYKKTLHFTYKKNFFFIINY